MSKIIKCAICEKNFLAKSNNTKFCPDCRVKAQQWRNKKCSEKKGKGEPVRNDEGKIVRKCVICNKEFIIQSGNQVCCGDEECSKKLYELRKKKNKYNANYSKENYDRIVFYVGKDEKVIIRRIADELGMSVNAFMNYVLNHFIKDKFGNYLNKKYFDPTQLPTSVGEFENIDDYSGSGKPFDGFWDDEEFPF